MTGFDAGQLAAWAEGEWHGAPPATVAGFAHDTRSLRPGDCFVALPGAHVDGHTFVAQALSAGASAALVARDRLPALAGCGPLLVVRDPLQALGAMAAAHRRQLGAHIVAVTGSVGKTTVKDLVASLLATQAPTARTRGNWNNELGLPLSLLAMTDRERVGVFEVGISHPGEMAPLCAVLQPDWGVITPVGPVHIEFFESEAHIAREKADLLRALPRQGRAFFSRDGAHADLLAERCSCPLVTVSARQPADYRIHMPAQGGEAHLLETASGDRFRLRLGLPGRHNLENAALAIAVARTYGASWDALESALAEFQAPPMRWERRAAGDVTFINDAYNANPVSMQAALDTFREEPAAGGQWLVLGDMRELGAMAETAHRMLGAQVAKGSWRGLVTVGALGGLIADAAVAAGFPAGRTWRCENPEQADAVLAAEMKAGDVALLKASRGVHLERILEHRAAMRPAADKG